jgi:hypothetical protein
MVNSQSSRAEKLKAFWDSLGGFPCELGADIFQSPWPASGVRAVKNHLASEQQRIRDRFGRRVRLAKRIFRWSGLDRFLHEIHTIVETDPDVLLSYLSQQAGIFLQRNAVVDQTTVSPQIVALIEDLQNRLQVKSHRLHQQPCYPATTAKRAALAVEYLTPASRVLCMGDDDFVSIALAMMAENEITVIDLDQQVISLIQEMAKERKLRITAQIVDICRPLPSHFISTFDVIVMDPIYFISDMMNFLSAAEQCLSPSAGAALLSCCARALIGPAWITVENWATSRNLLAEKVFDGFNEYPKPARTQALLSLGERLLCRTPLTRACATIPDAYSDLVVFRRIERGGSR